MSGVSSGKLAVIALAANLTACALVGTTLLVARSSDGEATAAPPTSSTPASTTPSTTPTVEPSEPTTPTSSPSPTTPSPTKPGVPAGFQPASAPGGLTTLIPSGWPAKPQANRSTAMQATNPAQPTSFLRYGGSASPPGSLLAIQTQGERGFAGKYPGYQRLALTPGKWRGHESVTWEFEFNTAAGRKHVNSIYWRVGRVDYVLYASSLVTNWPTMKAIYTTALGATKP
ncbi:hypothetical protein EV646_105357 [Kribbella antiqua]|uniref:Serine/threonine protein kinase n=1 Tax=Kribbella antiqua TaxID=2512217 RepID=A0A4V2S4D1_9ACTN|nr:hypothetical protein [Kribbella antiqua]TCO47800.1 hypothetical protein EV646_105357 [Kribbella antiqua]